MESDRPNLSEDAQDVYNYLQGLEYELRVYQEKINHLPPNDRMFLRLIGGTGCTTIKHFTEQTLKNVPQKQKDTLCGALYFALCRLGLYPKIEFGEYVRSRPALQDGLKSIITKENLSEVIYRYYRERKDDGRMGNFENMKICIMAMPYIRLGSLQEYIKTTDDKETLFKYITITLLACLKMYNMNMNHNDIHLGNILIDEAGPIIYDFDRAYMTGIPNPVLSTNEFMFPCKQSQCNLRKDYCTDAILFLGWICAYKREILVEYIVDATDLSESNVEPHVKTLHDYGGYNFFTSLSPHPLRNTLFFNRVSKKVDKLKSFFSRKNILNMIRTITKKRLPASMNFGKTEKQTIVLHDVKPVRKLQQQKKELSLDDIYRLWSLVPVKGISKKPITKYLS